MLKERTFFAVLLASIAGGFVFGVVTLFQLRFEQGDIYPPYSTLRSDPLGTKVFFESVTRFDHVMADRLFEPLRKLETGRDTTLFILGAQASDMDSTSADDASELERFLLEGGRLVVSFEPVTKKTWSVRRKEAAKQDETDKTSKPENPRSKRQPEEEVFDDEDFRESVALSEKWGFQYSYRDLLVDEEGVSIPQQVVCTLSNGLPESISWHTALQFTELDPAWRSVYMRGTNAVIIERSFGRGSIVLAADSYLFSNEAMRDERLPSVLAWITGPGKRLLFDETHLGIQAAPGIVALARKHRLHGLVAGLIILAALFVWKNSLSLVPPADDEDKAGIIVTGKDSSEAFVNLLRRSISPAEILNVSFAEWKKSTLGMRAEVRRKLEKIEAVVNEENARPARERDPVRTYRTVSAILSERR